MAKNIARESEYYVGVPVSAGKYRMRKARSEGRANVK